MMTNTNKKEAEVIEPILIKDMELMQFKHQTHVCITRTRRTVEQLQDERTWAFASAKIQMHDRVEIMDAQASQLAKGIVLYVSGNNVKVQIYALYPLSEQDRDEIPYKDYLVRWGGVSQKWIIVGKDTGDTLKGDFPSDMAAIEYLKDHYKALMT